jgi:two-component system, chemotaxis family, protein-glutamate methylesterase/glutaminase
MGTGMQAQGRPSAVVAVAASAGGIEALSSFVGALPEDFSAAILLVLHIPPTGTSVLPRILSRAGRLPARHPRDGERLTSGVIYVAPPDRHLVIEDGRVWLSAGPRESGHRPSADVLLRSVASSCGERAAGVILSGTMDDGAAGLRAIRAVGGVAMVQDPDEAAFPGMPAAAIEEADPQIVASAAKLADRLCEWLDELPKVPSLEAVVNSTDPDPADIDELTPLTCPECGGTLWLHEEYGARRFRCRVGHAFSIDGMLVGKQTAVERALWAAVVALEERADLTRRVAKRMRDAGSGAAHLAQLEDDVASALERAEELRDLVREIVQEATRNYEEASDDAGSA